MKRIYLLLALAGAVAFPAHAQSGISAKQTEVMKQLLATYAEKAKAEEKDPAKKGLKASGNVAFSADLGREFYLKRRTWQAKDFTCSGCHTEDPAKEGKHIQNGKPIKPLAPSANPERFTDAKKVERSFTEHCFDLHERDCNAYEKGLFIAYLMSVK